VGLGVAGISVSIGGSLHFDAKAAHFRDIIGKDMVLFVNTLQEFLCAPIYVH
jgi:hypothetical protein